MTQIKNFAHNYVSAQVDAEGFTSFSRFTAEQIKVYGKNSVFRMMAQTPAGVKLSFTTTGSEISLTCKRQSIIKLMFRELGIIISIFIIIRSIYSRLLYGKASNVMADYFDILVNGKLISSVKPVNGTITVPLGNTEKNPVKVRIYLPYLHKVKIKNLTSNGNITPDTIKKESIFCMGDSITQGCFSGKPSLSYVARLGEALDADALNLGVSGYIYDEASLSGLEALPKPKFITVAYGTNDWTQSRDIETLRGNIRAFYTRLLQLYSDIPIYVITPLWRKDMGVRRSCGGFSDVAHLIKEEVLPYSNITVVDGLSLTPHDSAYFADRYLHPNDRGFEYLSRKLLTVINSKNDVK